jgi:hypothetical protein
MVYNDDILWNNKDVYYIITFEDWHDDSYPKYKTDKVYVETFDKFKSIIKNELNIIHEKYHIQYHYIHYIIDNNWREFKEKMD